MQTNMWRRREQYDRTIFSSFRKWQYNAAQGHCTATTYSIFTRSNLGLPRV